ncbi:unnamed protein product [Alopecurus aequalis]
MAAPDEADAESAVGHKRGKKAYMLETMRCLMFARDNLPGDVYDEFVKTMTEIRKQCADPDGEIRSICAEDCIGTAMKLLQGSAPVKQGFLNFTQGRSLFDADVDSIAAIQSPLDFLRRAKACPDISRDDYDTIVQTMLEYSRKRTRTPREIFHIVKQCLRNCPEMLEEFTNYLPADQKEEVLADEKSCRDLKAGRMGKATLCFTPGANQSLDGTQIKATSTGKEGSEEHLLAEEDEKDKVKPLPEWIKSRGGKLPPRVEPENCTHCTPSYYLLPHNCTTLRSSYRTQMGRSILNDTLVAPTSVESLRKDRNKFEENMIKCEDDMFESDMLLQRFRETADFIANLQDRVDSVLRINEHITPLHRRCIQKIYNDDPELDDLLESQNTGAALSVLLSRLNQRVEFLSEARSSLDKILSPLIAENYYRSLDHRGPSFKQLDAKRMGHKALLAEAKEIQKSRLNAGDEYANPDIHKDISWIISSVRSPEEKLMMTWTEIVHPFLSANSSRSYLEETVAPGEACEHCGISKDFLSSISDALAANNLPLSPKEGELPRKTYNEHSTSRHGFSLGMEQGEFIPDIQTVKSDEPEKKHAPRQLSKRTTKPRSGTCCSLVVLCRLYQILYRRLQTAKDLCTGDLYTRFKDQLCKLLDRCIDNCKFEDFCLKFLGPKSFELFTLDIVINKVIKQLSVICSSDSLIQFLERLGRPIPPKILSPHQNPSTGLHDRQEHEGKLPLHFERRKRRKLENVAASSSPPAGGTQTPT